MLVLAGCTKNINPRNRGHCPYFTILYLTRPLWSNTFSSRSALLDFSLLYKVILIVAEFACLPLAQAGQNSGLLFSRILATSAEQYLYQNLGIGAPVRAVYSIAEFSVHSKFFIDKIEKMIYNL